MMKATNVQYQNFNRRFEVVKCLKKARNFGSKRKKVARRFESCSKSEKLLEFRKVAQKWPSNLWTALKLQQNQRNYIKATSDLFLFFFCQDPSDIHDIIYE